MPPDLADGIYFNMPMEQYVLLPRLGAHGLGKLLVSAATFWESSWLNPRPRKVSASTIATRLIGTAYHCARLELEHFEARYVRELDKADMPEGSLFTGAEMGAYLARLGLPKSGSVAEQAERLLESGFRPELLWHVALAKWEEQRGDRIGITPETWDEIVTDGERLRQSPDVAAKLDGGEAEVTLLWTDANGIPCKCRPDKLNVDRWLDVKTFSNSMGKNVEQAIADDFRFYRYHVGAAHYRDGLEEVRGGNLQIIGEATDAQRALIEAITQRADELECWYVFQEKGGVPNILAKQIEFHELPIGTTMNEPLSKTPEHQANVERLTRQKQLWFTRAQIEIRKAKRLFRTYSQVYEPGDAWLPFKPLGTISDMSFPAYFLDEEVGE